MASKAMEQLFQEELDEAPYIARMRAMLNCPMRFPHGPSQVLDHVYVGSEEDAVNIKLLRDLGITHVVNCAAAYTSTSQEFYGDIKFLSFEAEDDGEYMILQHFDDAYKFIEDARTSGGKALIHCLMGINRSCAITVAYCMVHKNMGPISAARMVKKARLMILSNDGFQRQLITFAREKGYLHLDKDEL